MPGHPLIVVGASAGGVEAASALVAGLPPNLPAAVCVVVHLRPYGESRLAEILGRATALPTVSAKPGLALRPGTIYVAVPDMHLLVERDGDGGVLRLTRGPKENRARPAVDPLFRSAALAYGAQAIGVVLSGALDDGTAGLWAIRDRGGVTVVQDPADALVASMPQSALDEVGADHMAPAAALGPLLARLAAAAAVPPSGAPGEPSAPTASTGASPADASPAPPDARRVLLEREVAMAALDEVAHVRNDRYGVPSRFACPECTGVLWDVSGDGPVRFRCETGHAYSVESLAEDQTESLEAALWAALRAFEDKIALAQLRVRRAADHNLGRYAERYAVQEEAAQQHAAALRALLRLDGRTSVRPTVAPGAGTRPQE